jgi:hypothetical protein
MLVLLKSHQIESKRQSTTVKLQLLPVFKVSIQQVVTSQHLGEADQTPPQLP